MIFRILAVLSTLVVLIPVLVYIGLQFDAPGFAPEYTASGAIAYAPPPSDLPAPVAGFIASAYGEELPVIETAMISGTADLRINGLPMPSRFKFYYKAGVGHFHDIETTIFGMKGLSVRERYMNGSAILDIQIIGREENEPKIDEASRMGYWAEIMLIPPLLLLSPDIAWQPIDATSAMLIVPEIGEELPFTVTFDPTTGYPATLSTLRYQQKSSTERIGWMNHLLEWRSIDGVMVVTEATTQWADANTPWARWHIEDAKFNVDVKYRFDPADDLR